MPHDADTLALPASDRSGTQSTGIFLSARPGHVYWAAAALGSYVMDIACE
jgi:hypothetical protein